MYRTSDLGSRDLRSRIQGSRFRMFGSGVYRCYTVGIGLVPYSVLSNMTKGWVAQTYDYGECRFKTEITHAGLVHSLNSKPL